MKKTLTWIFLITVLELTISCNSKIYGHKEKQEKPKISFTFDDGQTNAICNYKLEVWNQMLLDNLKKHNLKAIIFSSGANKLSEQGKYVLTSWNNQGHLIANHTFSHPNFNSINTSLESFKEELIQNDSIIKSTLISTHILDFLI